MWETFIAELSKTLIWIVPIIAASLFAGVLTHRHKKKVIAEIKDELDQELDEKESLYDPVY